MIIFMKIKLKKSGNFFLKEDIDFVQNLPFIKNDFAMQKEKIKQSLSFWPYLAPKLHKF